MYVRLLWYNAVAICYGFGSSSNSSSSSSSSPACLASPVLFLRSRFHYVINDCCFSVFLFFVFSLGHCTEQPTLSTHGFADYFFFLPVFGLSSFASLPSAQHKAPSTIPLAPCTPPPSLHVPPPPPISPPPSTCVEHLAFHRRVFETPPSSPGAALLGGMFRGGGQPRSFLSRRQRQWWW